MKINYSWATIFARELIYGEQLDFWIQIRKDQRRIRIIRTDSFTPKIWNMNLEDFVKSVIAVNSGLPIMPISCRLDERYRKVEFKVSEADTMFYYIQNIKYSDQFICFGRDVLLEVLELIQAYCH